MDERKLDDKPGDATSSSRRDFMKGATVAGVVIGADEYVKPTLKMLGVTRLVAAASTPPPVLPPPPPQSGKGCTPDFGGTTARVAKAAGWNGGMRRPMRSGPPTAGVVRTRSTTTHHSRRSSRPTRSLSAPRCGPSSTAAADRSRRGVPRGQLVAAYLNASYGGYSFTPSQLSSMWSQAVSGGNSTLNALSTLPGRDQQRVRRIAGSNKTQRIADAS